MGCILHRLDNACGYTSVHVIDVSLLLVECRVFQLCVHVSVQMYIFSLCCAGVKR